jgi:hypothetical protein
VLQRMATPTQATAEGASHALRRANQGSVVWREREDQQLMRIPPDGLAIEFREPPA